MARLTRTVSWRIVQSTRLRPNIPRAFSSSSTRRRRLEAMRRALVFAAKSAETDAWSPKNIRVAYCPGESALAWLLVGWLASRLQWPPAAAPAIHEAVDDDARLSVTIGSGGDGVIA